MVTAQRTLGASRTNSFPTPKFILGVSLLSAALIAAAAVAAGTHLVAYLSLFGLSILANALLFIPSGRVPILIGAALVLNPVAVAVVGGTGGAIGEMSGYILGRSSRKVFTKDRLPAWLRRCAERYLPITILLTSAIPNPFADAVSIMAGRRSCPVWKFLVLTIIGKVVQAMVLVHLALWNIALISSWLR